MLRATQSSEIPAGDTGRIRAEDSDRTRMLKEVMKSVAKYASGGLGKGSNESALAAGQLILKSCEDDDLTKVVAQKEWDPVDSGWLSAEQESRITSTVNVDEQVLDLLNEQQPESSKAQRQLLQYVDVLKHTGSRVRKNCENLSVSGVLPERPPRIESGPLDVQLISRIEAEEVIEGGATDKERRDQAAGAWVQENVKFEELETLTKRIDGSQYEELRGSFEQHHVYHPCLGKLTDHTLEYECLWQAAVQEAMFPTEVETKVKLKASTNSMAPKALLRNNSKGSYRLSPRHSKAAGKSTRISFAGAHPAGSSLGSSMGKMQRGGSVPALVGR